VGDFNGDGKLDLVASSESGAGLSVLLGNGNGTFQTAIANYTGLVPDSVAVGDFNHDGKLDLAEVDHTVLGVYVLLGNGNGTFQSAKECAQDTGDFAVAVGDLNGDGKLDIVAANIGANTVSVLLGNGNGTFQTAANYAVGNGPTAVAVGDFNGDGKLDIVTTASNSNGVSVLLNNGKGSFPARSDFLFALPPDSVAVGDFNGDGKPDVVVTEPNTNVVAVLLNTTVVNVASDRTAVTENEGATVTNTGTFGDFGSLAAVTLTASVGTVTQNNTTGTWSWSYTPPDGPASTPVTITAKDTRGQTATTTFTLTVNNVPPTPALKSLTGTTGVATEIVLYDLSATDPSSVDTTAGFTFRVNWGDGSAVETLATTAKSFNHGHAFTTTGTYTITLTATDKDGGVSSTTTSSVTIIALTSTNLQTVINQPVIIQQGSLLFQEATDAQAQTLVSAVNGLAAQTTPMTIYMFLGNTSYTDLAFSPKAGITLVINGSTTTTIVGHSPALDVAGGNVVIENLTMVTDTNSPTLVVTGGSLTLRNVDIEGSSSNQPAIQITGGKVDLGTASDPGNNTINTRGLGELIHNAGGNGVSAVGDTFQVDGEPLSSPYRIKDKIFDALNAGGGGLVTYVPGQAYISVNGGDIQRGVNAIAPGGTVNVETGGLYKQYDAGSKLVSIAFENGPVLTQLADALNPSVRSLVVTGTPGNDKILFNPGAGNGSTVKAVVNDVAPGTFSPTGRLIAYGGAGDDDIQVAGGITLPAWLYGGDGNDRLKGGGGNNVLLGGAGDDQLLGGAGRNLLIGGLGADQLVGSKSDDLLIAGPTAFDANVAALNAIMAEWTSARSFAARVANLSGSGSGPRANGNVFLLASGPGATVFDDGAVDQLQGAAGTDWYFANLSGGVTDVINGLGASGLVEELGVLAP
jgi:hypothetical protein